MKSLNTVGKNINSLEEKFDSIRSSKVVRNLRKLPLKNELLINSLETRWDMISQFLYGSTSYDWILAQANGIRSEDLKIGLKIKYPDLADLNKFLTDYV